MAYDQQPGYIDNLLAIRGLSSIGVALVHTLNNSSHSMGTLLFSGGLNGWLYDFLRTFWPVTGRNFVMFFFVHSGYLMGKVFYEGRYELSKNSLFRFYRGRLLRIAPLLYVSLAFYAAFYAAANPNPVMLLGDVFFFNNLTDRGINPVTWSLSWEMQYYLLAPFVFFFFSLPKRAYTLGLFLAISILSWLYVQFNFYAAEYLALFLAGYSVNVVIRSTRIVKFPFSNSIGILLGFFIGNMLFYYFWNQGCDAISFLVIMLCAWLTIFTLELPYSRQAEPSPHFYASYGHARILFLRGMTWLGVISYGVYLWHFAIISAKQNAILAVVDYLNKSSLIHSPAQKAFVYHLVQVPVVLGLAILLSFLTFFLIELRYRPHLYNIANSRYITRRVARWIAP